MDALLIDNCDWEEPGVFIVMDSIENLTLAVPTNNLGAGLAPRTALSKALPMHLPHFIPTTTQRGKWRDSLHFVDVENKSYRLN